MSVWILLYHGVAPRSTVDHADCRLTIDHAVFAQQLALLKRMDMVCRTIDELPRLSSEDRTDGYTITFDDGYRNNYDYAFPALLDAGMSACFYIIAGKVDVDSQFVTGRHLREMADAGMTIGSHTMTHPFLTEVSSARIRQELADSRARLEDIIGQEVVHFAIPGGHYDRRVIDIARECGYRSAATCRVDTFDAGDDMFQLPRFEIRDGLSLGAFGNTFRRSKVRQLKALEFGKACLRRSLGLSTYGRLRQAAHRWLKLTR